MGYRVLYRPEVVEDLASVPANLRQVILRAIGERLGTEPTLYGECLWRSLRGLRKLRVGDYRVCYDVQGDTVTIWAVLHRKEVYEVADKRRRREGPA